MSALYQKVSKQVLLDFFAMFNKICKNINQQLRIRMTGATEKNSAQHPILEVFIAFLKLGLTSFGGPAAHIGYFKTEFVDKKNWISDSQFAQLLGLCQFLPGPASSQLGFSLGLIRAGWLGAIVAFLSFTLPSVLMLFAFAFTLPLLSAEIGTTLIHGLKLVACIVVADAVIGMYKNLCPDTKRKCLAMLVTCFILVLNSVWSQLLTVCISGIIGIFICRNTLSLDKNQLQVRYSKKLGAVLFLVFLILLFSLTMLANENMIVAIAHAFYNAGAMVFGGGHVVLPLLEHSVVNSGWISNEVFLSGYGASQAIPGPMFAFSAYLGALIPTQFSPLFIATIALIFMFLPGFLLLAAVLPLWQTLSKSTTTLSAIAGINSSVVGILAAALYDPILTSAINSSIDLAIVIIGFCLLSVCRLSPLIIVLWCILATMLMKFI